MILTTEETKYNYENRLKSLQANKLAQTREKVELTGFREKYCAKNCSSALLT